MTLHRMLLVSYSNRIRIYFVQLTFFNVTLPTIALIKTVWHSRNVVCWPIRPQKTKMRYNNILRLCRKCGGGASVDNVSSDWQYINITFFRGDIQNYRQADWPIKSLEIDIRYDNLKCHPAKNIIFVLCLRHILSSVSFTDHLPSLLMSCIPSCISDEFPYFASKTVDK